MTPEQLRKLTVKDLRSLASKHKLPGRTKMKKDELIAALSEQLATSTGTPAPIPASMASASSSSMPRQQKAPAPAPSTEENTGLPLPEHYGKDRLRLMVQDPFHVFAYWELAGDALGRARGHAGADATAILMVYTRNGSEQRAIDIGGGNYYLSVAPGESYRAELALRSPDGQLVPVVGSNEVCTPPAGPSSRIDEEWMAIDETFDELLQIAGLPGGLGGSASIGRDLAARLWHETGVSPLSSGSLSSHSLGSMTIAREHRN